MRVSFLTVPALPRRRARALTALILTLDFHVVPVSSDAIEQKINCLQSLTLIKERACVRKRELVRGGDGGGLSARRARRGMQVLESVPLSCQSGLLAVDGRGPG